MKNNIRDKVLWAFKNYHTLKEQAVEVINDLAAVGVMANGQLSLFLVKNEKFDLKEN